MFLVLTLNRRRKYDELLNLAMNSKWKQNDRNQNSPLIITFIEELFSWVLMIFIFFTVDEFVYY